jgi:hypothetical protein
MPKLLDRFDGSIKDEKASDNVPAEIEITGKALGRSARWRSARWDRQRRNAGVGPLCVRDFHHRDDADPARDTTRIIGKSDELPDVAGGGVAGDLDVRGRSGGRKGRDSEPLLWKRCDAGRNRRHWVL